MVPAGNRYSVGIGVGNRVATQSEHEISNLTTESYGHERIASAFLVAISLATVSIVAAERSKPCGIDRTTVETLVSMRMLAYAQTGDSWSPRAVGRRDSGQPGREQNHANA